MNSLFNRFILVGAVSEGYVDAYPSHLRFRLVVDGYTVYAFAQKKFQEGWYNQLLQLQQSIKTEIPCQGFQQGYSRVYIIGSVSQSDTGLWFNADYIAIAQENIPTSIKIDIEGQFVKYNERYQFLSIKNDSPNLFDIQPTWPGWRDDSLYRLELQFNNGVNVGKDRVVTYTGYSLLSIKNHTELDEVLNQDTVDKMLLEWEVTHDES